MTAGWVYHKLDMYPQNQFRQDLRSRGFVLLAIVSNNVLESARTVRDPRTTWTILQHNGPDHLGLWRGALPGRQMALITSNCVPFRTGSINSRTWGRSAGCSRITGTRS